MLEASTRWQSLQGAYRTPRAEPPEGEWDRFAAPLDDDFNTPAALAVLHDWQSRGFWYLLDEGLAIFGLRLPPMPGTGLEEERLRRDREAARAAKDWALADELRDELRKRGFDVVDEPAGSRLVPQ